MEKQSRCPDYFTADACSLVTEAKEESRLVQRSLRNLILDEKKPESAFQDIIGYLEVLQRLMVRIQENADDITICFYPIAINDALEGTINAIHNVEFLACNRDCDDLNASLAISYGEFSQFTAANLNMLFLACSVQNSEPPTVCKECCVPSCSFNERSTDMICKVLKNTVCTAVGAERILDGIYNQFQLEENEPIEKDLISMLSRDFEIISSELEFVQSQICTTKTKCSKLIVEARIINALEPAIYLQNTICDLLEDNDPCTQLSLLSLFYRFTRSLMGLTRDIFQLVGCCSEDEYMNEKRKGDCDYVTM